jgi:hypothetical protein
MEIQTKQAIADNVFPKSIRASALQQEEGYFVRLLGDTKLLLFKLQNPNDNLIPDLSAENTMPVIPKESHFKYRTSAGKSEHQESLWKMPLIGQEEVRVRHSLSEGPHYIAPLKKHVRSGRGSPERITVGRAQNQDLVIDHTSVSKIQSWFEIDKRGEFYLSDAGSTNGTYVNSRPIVPRQRVQLRAGDYIRFANVEAVFCCAETVWRVLHSAVATEELTNQQ